MKKLILFSAFLIVTLTTSVFAACTMQGMGGMPAAFHEFAVFGNNTVYLSHYPMFSSIHAYQIIVQVKLESADHDAQDKFLKHKAQHPGTSYTFSPYRKVAVAADRTKDQDDWVLPDMMREGNQINGDIHFTENKNDVTLDFNVTARIEKVAYHHMFDPKETRPSALSYVLFGTQQEAYLAHVLSAPPNPGEEVRDFDQILAADLAKSLDDSAFGKTFSIPTSKNVVASKLRSGDKISLRGPQGDTLPVSISGELYDGSISTQR